MRCTRLVWAAGAVAAAVLPVGSQLPSSAASVAPDPGAVLVYPTSHHAGPAVAGPPTTSYCEAHFGIACYQPQQIRQAYNLGPLTTAWSYVVDHHLGGVISQSFSATERTFHHCPGPSGLAGCLH